MKNLAIVAIPDKGERVWDYSSEKVPHMTLLFFGDQDVSPEDLKHLVDTVQHTAETSLRPFYMSVDERSELGPDKADVLLFKTYPDREGNYSPFRFRDLLLGDSNIKTLYDSVEQYPEFTPHLTMGYPKKPAKPDDGKFDHWSGVYFNRIAVWTGEYEGPEFKLESEEYREESMLMSDKAEDFLEHFGVKGMKWGVRRNDGAPVNVTTNSQPGKKITATGGHNQPHSTDAGRAAAYKQIAKKSTTDALDTKQLQELVNRMNLEQQYARLSKADVSPGRKFVDDLLKNAVKQEASKYVNQQGTALLKDALQKKAKAGGF